MPERYIYQGSELDLFARARNWKEYWGGMVEPYLGKRVLDVGAGLGATARLLSNNLQTLWLAVEPDPHLAERIEHDIATGVLPAVCKVHVGTVNSLDPGAVFDTVLYIDVLEHISNDRAELQSASQRILNGGYLVVLAPAHQWLFTSFDRSIGHFRRYSSRSLMSLTPPGMTVHRSIYLDSVGMLASLANRLILKSSMPSARQIRLWDDVMVRTSRYLDVLTRFKVGKSILVVWRKGGT